MVDVVNSATRSRMMASIRGKNTNPEVMVRRFLHARGFRFRLHVRSLPGTPDLVLPKYNLAIFVHGCFWHQHPGCRFATMPDENREKWERKFAENLARDQRQLAALVNEGWRVLIVWECGVRTAKAREQMPILQDLVCNPEHPISHYPEIPPSPHLLRSNQAT
jgi:DNA mismatch endonuclease (patch repair protein)